MESSQGFILVIMLLVVALTILKPGCATDPESTVRTLEDSGYTQVIPLDRSWFGCGDDWYCTKFSAINPASKKVSGVVGCGLMVKSCTVRF